MSTEAPTRTPENEHGRSYENFTDEDSLKKRIEQLNKGRNPSAFYANEKTIRIRSFQASGSHEHGAIEFERGQAVDATWHFRASFG